jgi:hypothetical protein
MLLEVVPRVAAPYLLDRKELAFTGHAYHRMNEGVVEDGFEPKTTGITTRPANRAKFNLRLAFRIATVLYPLPSRNAESRANAGAFFCDIVS